MSFVTKLPTEMKGTNAITNALKKQAGDPALELSNIYSGSKGEATIYMSLMNKTRGAIYDIQVSVNGVALEGESKRLDYKAYDGYCLGKALRTEDGYRLENWLIAGDAVTDVHVDVDTRDLVAHFVLDLDGYIKDVFASQG